MISPISKMIRWTELNSRFGTRPQNFAPQEAVFARHRLSQKWRPGIIGGGSGVIYNLRLRHSPQSTEDPLNILNEAFKYPKRQRRSPTEQNRNSTGTEEAKLKQQITEWERPGVVEGSAEKILKNWTSSGLLFHLKAKHKGTKFYEEFVHLESDKEDAQKKGTDPGAIRNSSSPRDEYCIEATCTALDQLGNTIIIWGCEPSQQPCDLYEQTIADHIKSKNVSCACSYGEKGINLTNVPSSAAKNSGSLAEIGNYDDNPIFVNMTGAYAAAGQNLPQGFVP
uniref:Uncharacterized protein n=1 Tax=Globodera rostochiensis TaxID=31243 RepID=A0A914HTB5_GLORO